LRGAGSENITTANKGAAKHIEAKSINTMESGKEQFVIIDFISLKIMILDDV
jgi:hypothetical protein